MSCVYHGTRPRALRYTGGWKFAKPRRQSIMAKVKALWEGLTEGRAGTYIRPHTDGTYEFGRWAHCLLSGGYRFTRLGDRPTREACRLALEADDKAHERRAKLLNTRKR